MASSWAFRAATFRIRSARSSAALAAFRLNWAAAALSAQRLTQAMYAFSLGVARVVAGAPYG